MIRKAKLIRIVGNKADITMDGVKIIRDVQIVGDPTKISVGDDIKVQYSDERLYVVASGAALLTSSTSSTLASGGSGGGLTPHSMEFHYDHDSWHAGLTGSSLHNPKGHGIVSSYHTATGLTVGHALLATGTTSFAFGAITEDIIQDGSLLARLADDETITGNWTFPSITVNGNIVITGTVDGVDVSDLKTDVDGFPDELKNLTTAEIQQLENIDATTISATQWGYLGALDQGLSTTDSVTFAGLDITGLTDGYVPYVGTGGLADSPIYTDGTKVSINSASPGAMLDVVPSSSSVTVFRTKSLQSSAPLGSELVTNGTFDSDLSGWTIGGSGSGWSWSSDGKAQHSTGNTDTLYQNISVTNGQTYQVEITVSDRTAGNVTVDIGGVYIYKYGSNGNLTSSTYKRSLVASGTGSQALTVTPTSDFDGKIDDVTVKLVTGASQPNVVWLDDNGDIALEGRANYGLGLMALGKDAGRHNTTGSSDVFIGINTGYYNTTGSYNTFLGYNAGSRNTTGDYNLFLGSNAGYENTTGAYNSFLGTNTGYNNTTGYSNVFVGYAAGYNNTTGFNSTFSGYAAGYNNTTGYNNVFTGRDAGGRNTTGHHNTFIGRLAGFYTSGNSDNQTSSNSVLLGYNTKVLNDGDSNEIVIGYNAVGNGSDTVTLGNDSITKTFLNGSVGVGTDPSYTLDVNGTFRVVNGAYLNGALDVDGAATFGDDLTVGANILFVDNSGSNVGINRAPDSQFDLDVNGNMRAGGWIVGKHAIQLSDALMICHFDGPEPYETDFTGSAEGHMGQVPDVSGGVIFRPGKFGKAVQIAEATTNYIFNPQAYNDVNNWSVHDVTLVRDTSMSWIGPACFKVSKETGQTGYSFYPTKGLNTISDGESVTLSVRIYKPSDSAATDIKFRIKDITNNVSYWTDEVTATDEWVTVSVTFTNNTGADAQLMVYGNINGVAGSNCYYRFDVVQLEKKAYVTPYCDGSLGDGHSWSGTDHASTSSRTAAALEYDSDGNIKHDVGTIKLWAYVGPGVEVAGDYSTLFLVVDSDTITNRIMLHWSSHRYLGRLHDGDGNINLLYGPTSLATGWHHFALTWSSSESCLYVDGELYSKITNPTIPDSLSGSTIYIGEAWGGQTWNDKIDEFVIAGRVLTADEIRAIYESQAPVFAETSTWTWRTPNNLAWADAEGLWAIDEDGDAAFGVAGVDSKSWGGQTLNKGDVLLGNGTQYVLWDASAGTLSVAGEISATTGEIGGWTIGTDALAGGDATLHSDGYLLLGTSNDIARIDASDATYRMWVGNATAASAPFRVSKSGEVWATNAHITGEIDANSGSLGSLTVDGTLDVSTGGVIKSGATAYNSGTGWWFEYNAGTPRAFIGNGSGNKLLWDGSALTIAGEGSGITNIDGGNIQTNTVTATQIATNTITASEIAADTITASEIAANTITAAEIAAGTITATEIASGTITGDKISLTSYLAINSSTFGNDGIQLDYNSGDPRAYIGNGSNRYFKFDGSTITWKAANTELDVSGNLTASSATISGAITATSGSITGVLNMGDGGEIRLGSGTVGTDFTGLRMYRSGTTYRLAGYNSDTLQAYFNSDGKLYAGGGNVVLDSDGVTLTFNDILARLTWKDSSSNTISKIFTDTETISSSPLYVLNKMSMYAYSNSSEAGPAIELCTEDNYYSSESMLLIRSTLGSSSSYGFTFTIDSSIPLAISASGVYMDGSLEVDDNTVFGSPSSGYGTNAGDIAAEGDLWLDGSIYRHTPIATLLERTSDFAITTSGAWKVVSFDSVVSEQGDDMYDSSSPGSITLRRDGIYLLVGHARFDDNASNDDRGICFYHKNSSDTVLGYYGMQFVHGVSTSLETTLTTSAIVKGSDTDYVQFAVYQNTGGTLYLKAYSGQPAARFSVIFLGSV